jgi:diguanylate cyclase (GGDEF)-like protein/PAS domain S-box-containing protein
MTVITLLTVSAVYFVMERDVEKLLSKSLQVTLNARVVNIESEIEIAFARTASFATTPLLIDQLQLVNASMESSSVRQTLNTIAQLFVDTGLTAAALYGNDGRELARVGVLAQHPELTVPLNKLPRSVQLIWDGQLLLHTIVEVMKEERVVGMVITETRLPGILGRLKDVADLGETTELMLCAPFELGGACFPTALNPEITIIPLKTPDGTLLPMEYALEGRTGFIITKDYRNQTVSAAYAPVGDLGLGVVLKVDRAEFLAPSVWQLPYLILLLFGMLIFVLLLLRWRLTPLVELLTDEVAERKHAEALMMNREQRINSILNNVADGILTIDGRSIIETFNPAAESMFGYRADEVVGTNVKVLMLEPFHGENDTYLKTYLRSGKTKIITNGREITGLRKDGSTFPAHLAVREMLIGDTRVFTGSIRDISEAKAAEDKISELAFYDDLTSLPNRRMFHDKLGDEMKRSDRSGLPMVLMMLDLDNFKEVNDAFGHIQGDMLLVEVARRITACVRETDTVARLGGDEFTIILSEMKDVTKANHIAQSIIKSIADLVQLSEQTAFVSGSLGVALYPNDAQTADDLIASADQAMYVVKEAGGNSLSYFTAALQEAAHARQSLISDLRGALPGKQFALHYQPIVELASGKIYKAEALLRWQHPERGPVSPTDFIPVAEETGLIHEIGDWVFHEAIRELAHWRELFVPELQISVNVSPVQFRESQGGHRGILENSRKNWLNSLNGLGLPGESVVFEITEGVLLDVKASATDKLLEMRDAGIQVALDDFGTGYSSLSYLKKFDIDYLKIDQSFVENLENDADDRALCEAIIFSAHKLGLKVIAEGVETEPQRDLLVGFGCEYAQGWLYSKGLPADEFEMLLKEQGKVAQ